MMKRSLLSILLAAASLARAELVLPAVISDHMILQQGQENRIWGWDTAGTVVKVSFDGAGRQATCDAEGYWQVELPARDASYEPRSISIIGTTQKTIEDVLVGEVWICSGQSNMQWPMEKTAAGAVEILAAKESAIRLLTVPIAGSQTPLKRVAGKWATCSPESVREFSAIGYHFGRYLHEILDVPVGLIDNAWGGSSAEAWVARDTFDAHPALADRAKYWRARDEKHLKPDAYAVWEKEAAEWDKQNPKGNRWFRPREPKEVLNGRHRPGNIWGGMVEPILGYGMRGVIWYQGESNVGRAHEYRELFGLVISEWRKRQGQGDFPFYWAQLADFQWQNPQPEESDWAELREAQTRTLELPNTGEAVIIDTGEGNDIHPRDKFTVANRLVRHALRNDYSFENIECRSPMMSSVSPADGRVRVTFDHVGSGLRGFDENTIRGFALCGADGVWQWAEAKLIDGNTVELSSAAVPQPIEVRYGWANNPICNLVADNGLPATPFQAKLSKE